MKKCSVFWLGVKFGMGIAVGMKLVEFLSSFDIGSITKTEPATTE